MLSTGIILRNLPLIASTRAGFGGQIGAELTDFVFILNDASAVKTFSQAGSITLGGNVSIAAGPVGRNAEASGAASLRSVSGIFSYRYFYPRIGIFKYILILWFCSKTKGLFAGVSLEGSVIVERKDANKKFYNASVSAAQLLGGNIPAPPAADALTRVLRSRVFRGNWQQHSDTDIYNDIPVYDDERDPSVWEGRTGTAYGEGRRNSIGNGTSRATTWRDDLYDREPQNSNTNPRRSNTIAPRNNRSSTGSNPNVSFDTISSTASQQFQRQHFNSTYSDHSDSKPKSTSPGRPLAPKPMFPRPTPQSSTLGQNQAVALYSFEGDQAGDLSFKKVCIMIFTFTN